MQALSCEGTQQTLALFQQQIDVLFYDTTTLYFESFTEDALKQNGYSKDRKFNQPQVVLCMFVTTEGLPVGYDVFPGSTYEGHTLISILETLKKRFVVRHVVFVADSGLLNKENLNALDAHGYPCIVGARLKSLPKVVQKKITNLMLYTNVSEGLKVQELDVNGRRLISAKRAYKDQQDRLKAIEKMRKKLAKTDNPVGLFAHGGYKKYLKLQGCGT